MARWFVIFLFYSFAGYGLEKWFAYVSHSPHQVRKCFLLLPLCPVYGLGMCALLAVIPENAGTLPLLALSGGVCTGVEFLVHLFYDRFFQVKFWDYTNASGNIQGRICPVFSLIWCFLALLMVRFVQPLVEVLAALIPPWAVFLLWVTLAADCVLSAALLRKFRNIDALDLGWAAGQMWDFSQSDTSL